MPFPNYQRYLFLLLIGTVLVFIACKNDSTPKEKLPNTPEKVAFKWLNDYYNDRFEEAKKLSTPQTQIMIDTIASMLIDLPEDHNEPQISIKGMQCQMLLENTAKCQYFYDEEGYGPSKEEIKLIKINGQWLVDEDYND